MTLIELIKELKSQGVLEYKGKLNGEEVFLRLMSPNGAQLEAPAPAVAKADKAAIREAGQRSPHDGLTRTEQITFYGAVHAEDFQ